MNHQMEKINRLEREQYIYLDAHFNFKQKYN